MNWTELLKAEFEDAYSATDALMAKVDSGSLGWKPESGENWMTMGQLLLHLAKGGGEPSKGFVTGDWGIPPEEMAKMSPEEMMPSAEKMPTLESVDEARAMLAEDKKLAFEMIDKAGEDRLNDEPCPAPWDPRPMPLGQRLLSMCAHVHSHKSQLFYYLKLQGKSVNTNDLWGGA